ncbi:hypothetical protein C1929_06255 [Stenotrophomonas sp. ZAC14D1_NAIMI4_6]|nr:hypothetical protein C1929_06255 [Stenotrophomonas sp. ZAC14D1_NAIMI4_6]AWH40576.1 hypothetical protein C1927_06595 [Stenotrophomonas sp. ZAC14D1_NAIMI4_1]
MSICTSIASVSGRRGARAACISDVPAIAGAGGLACAFTRVGKSEVGQAGRCVLFRSTFGRRAGVVAGRVRTLVMKLPSIR